MPAESSTHRNAPDTSAFLKTPHLLGMTVLGNPAPPSAQARMDEILLGNVKNETSDSL